MRRIIIVVVALFLAMPSFAQIPFFAGTVGKDNLYGYTSLAARPGLQHITSYTMFQYGITDNFVAGMDLYAGYESAYWGATARYGYVFNKWFGIGAELTPSFNINHNFDYSYTTASLYMNGAISRDGRLFWCSNVWWTINQDAANAIVNYEYLAYTFPLGDNKSLTPMFGAVHSWLFDQPIDWAVGVYYSINTWNIYLWAHDFDKDNPQVVLGIDFALD